MPPAERVPESQRIKLEIGNGGKIREGEIMTVEKRINGFPWKLMVWFNGRIKRRSIVLMCKKNEESELWWCDASLRYFIGINISQEVKHRFMSWDKKSLCFGRSTVHDLSTIEVDIDTNGESGERFYAKPLVPYGIPYDSESSCVLILHGGNFRVNKKYLASQSSYFNALFYGGFKESNQKAIEIKDVTLEDMKYLLWILHGIQSIKVEEAEYWLQLAQRFDLKIVEDAVINCLLGSDSLSLHSKLLWSDQHNLKPLKSILLPMYKQLDLIDLYKSTEFSQFSLELTRELYGRFVEVSEK
ncbi:hypothetical protein PFISCL1PPCAC_11018 [Pristionchus fissidentatus]|uniref:BTB domain-containing protein n=1 Tax=Pristionchus fissidentatus TaxID=1538716 RepID=A0AAV5VJZ5_9BILA|nr:hypothetical protein PFISCL1PPCAC_11018 [Pristionchus fissidentatus]